MRKLVYRCGPYGYPDDSGGQFRLVANFFYLGDANWVRTRVVSYHRGAS
jgi:hypothetical protein